MKVVLNQNVKGIGKKFQIIDVSEGYARNYLLPRNIAKLADSIAINETKEKVEAQNFKKQAERNEALKLKKIVESKYIEFKCKVGANGKLFGSVTEKDIAEKVKEIYNLDIDKKKISLEIPAKQLGVYIAKIKLYEGITANLKVGIKQVGE